MQVYDIAVVEVEGQSLILVPINSSITVKTIREQNSFYEMIQKSAEKVGLAAPVVLVWRGYTGKMRSLAPAELEKSVAHFEWSDIMRCINGRLPVAQEQEKAA